jgi:hypothetical protein
MPRLDADFSAISSSFEPLAPGDYRARVVEIKDGATKKNNLPQLTFSLEVTDGEFVGRKITDFVVLKQNDGKVNNIGLGRVKAYAEAILGAEAANGNSIDTDELVGGECILVVSSRTYEKKNEDGSSGGQATSSDIKKVLPVG